jgi:hypothetical protein
MRNSKKKIEVNTKSRISEALVLADPSGSSII